MLRAVAARSVVSLEQGARLGLSRQWQPQRLSLPLFRAFADARTPEKVIVSGSHSIDAAVGAPVPTASDIPLTQIPPLPPSPAEVHANVPSTPTSVGNIQSDGFGSTANSPTSVAPPPPKKRRRFRNFFFTLFLLSAFGYAGGVYCSLINDNFHDFFTEYVPLGEDAVAYFEEREYRRRFPGKDVADRYWPQTHGENKVIIGRQSGVNPRLAATEDKDAQAPSNLSQSGRHLSAVDDNKAKQPADARKEQLGRDRAAKEEKPKTSDSTPAPAKPAALIDSHNVAEIQERAVQELVKMVNNIITTINASPDASKYQNTINLAKQDLDKVIGEIKLLRDRAAQNADSQIQTAHLEFDNAAKELVRRLEHEMHEQEIQWREEYEQEREKLSTSYQQKLSSELDAAKKVFEQKNVNALVEQEIALQKKFMDSVKAKVEEERNGRLSKLDELSSSVSELEKLTNQWNDVVDATLQTQHLQVALESVRAKLQESEHPTPFIKELVALKEVSHDNEVVNAAIASINPIAYQRGISSAASLIDRFRRVATEVRKASLLPEDAGVASHAASAVLSRLMFHKKSDRGLPEGDDVEATLARTEVLLEEGDLDAAAREMNNLQGWAGVLSRDWVSECRRVLEVRQAVEVISAEARLQSLLVE